MFAGQVRWEVYENAFARRFLKRTCGLMVASTVRRIWEMILSYQRRLFSIQFDRFFIDPMYTPIATNTQYWCNTYLSIWFFTLITESLLAPSCSSGPPQEENQEHQEALRGNKGLGAVSCLPFILGEICGPRSIQEWIKCLWNANRALWLKPQIFALSSSHSLRRDVYEKDVRLYWYEGGLRAKKLNFGQSLTPTCMRNSHIDIYHIIYNLIYCIYIYILHPHRHSYGCGEPKKKVKKYQFCYSSLSPLSLRKKHRNTTREESSDVDSDADLHGDLETGAVSIRTCCNGLRPGWESILIFHNLYEFCCTWYVSSHSSGRHDHENPLARWRKENGKGRGFGRGNQSVENDQLSGNG